MRARSVRKDNTEYVVHVINVRCPSRRLTRIGTMNLAENLAFRFVCFAGPVSGMICREKGIRFARIRISCIHKLCLSQPHPRKVAMEFSSREPSPSMSLSVSSVN
jgi:hypothetical protein